MGQRTVLATLLMALGAGSTAFAGPILITSFERTGNNPFHNHTTRTGFVFELSGVLSETSIFLGTDPTALPDWTFFPLRYWNPRDTGTLDFNAANDIGFPRFAEGLADTIDYKFTVWSGWTTLGTNSYRRTGYFWSESELFGDPNPLIGAQLDFIRLHVNEVSFDPHRPPNDEWQWSIQVEFYGTPAIPEPSAWLLVGSGALFLLLIDRRAWLAFAT